MNQTLFINVLLLAHAFDQEVGVVLDESRAGHHEARRVPRVFEGVPVGKHAAETDMVHTSSCTNTTGQIAPGRGGGHAAA